MSSKNPPASEIGQGLSDHPETESRSERRSYLRAGHSLRSWLLTTDHKRIALLYMASITFFFSSAGLLPR